MIAVLYVVGAVLAVAWLAIALVALFGDRSRGRRRCPKCFFSLDGLSVSRCPECGRDITNVRRFYRTRRRWGLVIVSAVLLLTPAALTAGFARIRQVGAWRDLPTEVLVRLLWLGDERLGDEVIQRIEQGSVSKAQAKVVVRYASGALSRDRERQSAYKLLEMIHYSHGRRSYANRPRTGLDECAADSTVPGLLDRLGAGDATERVRAIYLLGHLRDVDETANLAVLSHLADDDPKVAHAARMVLDSGRLRSDPDLPNFPDIWRLRRFDPPREENVHPNAKWLGELVRDHAHDRAALASTARSLALGKLAPSDAEPDEVFAKAAGLWLWCRLERGHTACWDVVVQFSSSTEEALRATAIQQLRCFPWSERTEAMLRTAITDPAARVQWAAFESAARFGDDAAALVPHLLQYAGSQRTGATGSFPDEFVAIGGDPYELLRTITERLSRVRAQWEDDAEAGEERLRLRTLSEREGDTEVREERLRVMLDFVWLAELNVKDDLAAEEVRWFIENTDPISESGLIVAYAVLSGDRTYATQILLDHRPVLLRDFEPECPQSIMFELLRRRLADEELLIKYFVHDPKTEQRAGFLDFLSLLNAVEPGRLREYRGLLRELASDGDAVVSQKATRLLGRVR